MKNYLDISVVIAPGTEGAYSVRLDSDAFGQRNSVVKLPFALKDLSGVVFGATETARAIGSLASQKATKSAEDFGIELFDALFRGEARDLLTSVETESKNRADTGVRVRLSMDLEAPGMTEAASIPWELMCRAKGEDAMAVSSKVTLVRGLDVMGKTEPAPFIAPLRVMVVMSNPTGTSPLNLEEERQQIMNTWGKLLRVKIDFVPPVAETIRAKLREHPYHVIHYMGHGDIDANGMGVLLLEQEDKSPDPVTATEFARWLEDEPLRLVFLNACKTGATSIRSGAHPFAGVATALIRRRVPAVVAMQFPISDPAAIVFAQTFYEAILEGHPVDVAVVAGRKELRDNKKTKQTPEWGTPVLYMRSKNGMLFDWGASDEAVSASVPAASTGAAAAPTAAAISPVAAAAAAASDDPWGPGTADALRVFLCTPDQNLLRRHAQLSQALKAIDGVRVIDSIPTSDATKHAATVENLVRRADLCIHMLGANPGMRLDEDDEQPLRTFPLVELDIARQAARSQLVVIATDDKESIGVKAYAALIDDLGTLKRDKARFELVITDRNRITDAARAKLDELKRARQAQAEAGVSNTASHHQAPERRAFVDSHVSDQAAAIDLVEYFLNKQIDTDVRASSGQITDFDQLDATVRKTSLYVIVAGSVDPAWVLSRKAAILKSAMRTKAPLLIANYTASASAGAESVPVTKSRFEIRTALQDSDAGWVNALFSSEESSTASSTESRA